MLAQETTYHTAGRGGEAPNPECLQPYIPHLLSVIVGTQALLATTLHGQVIPHDSGCYRDGARGNLESPESGPLSLDHPRDV